MVASEQGLIEIRRPVSTMNSDDLTIVQVQEMFDCGDLSAVDLCQALLERIDAIDRSGPTLKSVLEVNPDVVASAEACDRARESGIPKLPLNGIPILVKDSIDTADRTMTTAGSRSSRSSADRSC